VNIHFYTEDDVQTPRGEDAISVDGELYPFEFIADIPSDNPGALGDYDNLQVADRLERFGAVGKDDRLDCESCCFYIYFKTKKDGLTFIKKLNDYLSQKARLIRDAAVF
jgi:hypothetical protein